MNTIFSNVQQPQIKNKKLNQSISFDDSLRTNSQSFSNNPKLEEFKKVVESSYLKHVLQKNDLNSSLPRQMSLQSSTASSIQVWNNTGSSSSIDENMISIDQNQTDLKSSRINEALNMYKIPYLSAYNIYDPKKQEIEPTKTLDQSLKLNLNELEDPSSKIIMQKYFQSIKLQDENKNEMSLKTNIKKLASNGSSLTTSPTSLSSTDSNKKLNNDYELTLKIDNPMQRLPREAKPPETPKPKSAGLSFRKNMLKLSASTNFQTHRTSDSAKSSFSRPSSGSQRNSIDSTPNVNMLAKSFSGLSGSSNPLPSTNKLEPVKIQTKKPEILSYKQGSLDMVVNSDSRPKLDHFFNDLGKNKNSEKILLKKKPNHKKSKNDNKNKKSKKIFSTI